MQVISGAVVSITYTLTDDDDVIIDSNVGRPALVYLHGYDNIIPGLESGLEGASAGDRLKVDVAACRRVRRCRRGQDLRALARRVPRGDAYRGGDAVLCRDGQW